MSGSCTGERNAKGIEKRRIERENKSVHEREGESEREKRDKQRRGESNMNTGWDIHGVNVRKYSSVTDAGMTLCDDVSQ